MILHTEKLVFIHVPKCGGTSIEYLLTRMPLLAEHSETDDVIFSENPELSKIFPLKNRHGFRSEYEAFLERGPEGSKSPYSYFTLLRDPRKVVTSQFRYRKKMSHLWKHKKNGPVRKIIRRLMYQSFLLYSLQRIWKKMIRRSLFTTHYDRFLPSYEAYLKPSDGISSTPTNVFFLEEVSKDSKGLMNWLKEKNVRAEEFPRKNVTPKTKTGPSIFHRFLVYVLVRKEIKLYEKLRYESLERPVLFTG
ncbi:MAG: sulfotransferase family 2 domain-containing protein [Verrucomicrobiales bacterium]